MALQSLFKKCSSHYLIVAFFDGPVLAHFCPFFYFFAAMWVSAAGALKGAAQLFLWLRPQEVLGIRHCALRVEP